MLSLVGRKTSPVVYDRQQVVNVNWMNQVGRDELRYVTAYSRAVYI